jgi:hypothetical protein
MDRRKGLASGGAVADVGGIFLLAAPLGNIAGNSLKYRYKINIYF